MTVADGAPSEISDIFSILGNRRRVLLIRYLSLFERQKEVEVRHLARVLGGIETGTPPRNVVRDDYESVYNGLLQTHLPTLDERGVIEYDEQHKTVTVTTQIERYMVLAAISRFVVSAQSFK
ncbi:DUF7344 domain-containing protein [Salinibaculum rarum]|uniref:DUF7344 domain-containing protein n=1 Tax=Salinibaculum rarum TaxID=3058903 RepID=UPI00265E05FF|nr:hypothetical protein [Salinibaculum sp. KK48]